jgi:hypothetical protein
MMTEPDEALLWAFEDDATRWVDSHPGLAYADEMEAAAKAYRAGQAASAERIKALEGTLQEVVDDYDWVQGGAGDRDWNVLDNTIIRARNLLKEADQ